MKKLTAFLLALVLCLSLCSVTAFAGDSVAYIGADGKAATATATKLTRGVEIWDEEWYYVTGTFEINIDVKLQRDVNLILEDDACLTLSFSYQSEYTLTIYGQTSGSGKLNIVPQEGCYNGVSGNVIVNGGNVDILATAEDNPVCGVYGNLTVNGGNVKITAIGLTEEGTPTYGVNDHLTVNGGNVEITCNAGAIVGDTLTLAGNVSVNYGDSSSSTTTSSAPVNSAYYNTIACAKYAKFFPHTHTLTEVPVKSATCTEPGVKIPYWKCSCGAAFTAQTGGNEISKEQLAATYIEAAKGHDFSGTIKDNENGTHSYKCSRCDVYGYNGKVYQAGVEGFENCSGGTATCTTKAVCSKCGGSYGDVDATAHSFDTENWTYDETQHWHAATCGHDTEKGSVDNHVDEDVKDHKCDVCGYTMSECKDEDKDHKCDVCGYVMSECKDEDKNHKCDVCGKDMGGECADGDKDHKCDYCGKVLSECKDENGDGKCDTCGKDMGVPVTPTKPAYNPVAAVVKVAVKTTVAVVKTVAKVVRNLLKWF